MVLNKNKPDHSTPKAVHDCRELLLWIIPQLDKLPRSRRYILGEKLENRLLVVLESLVTAAYAPNKGTFLFKVVHFHIECGLT